MIRLATSFRLFNENEDDYIYTNILLSRFVEFPGRLTVYMSLIDLVEY